MLPIDVASTTGLLLRDTDAVLVRVSQQLSVVGFAYVFEVGQPEPCFHFAIDAGSSPADPSTGEWTHPAGGFDGAALSPEWSARYAQLAAYMADDDFLESRLHEVHAFLRSVMAQVRSRWLARLPQCVFTVNECHDSAEVVHAVYAEINRTA